MSKPVLAFLAFFFFISLVEHLERKGNKVVARGVHRFSSVLPVGGRAQPEIDASGKSTSGFVAAAVMRGLAFSHKGTFFHDYNLLGRGGIHLPRAA